MTNSPLICDRTHWGLLQITGKDKLRFLHNQTTNDLEKLKPGQGCDTIFVTSTGRTIDLATAYVTEDAVLLMVSPNYAQKLLDWMDRYIFPMDKVQLADISPSYGILTIMGPTSDRIIQNLGLETLINQPLASHQLLDIDGIRIRVAVGDGLGLSGYTIITPRDNTSQIWAKLQDLGATPIDETHWEKLRIQQGRPKVEQELTQDYNPLESGLWSAISFNKGCYIGQETIARLNTYKGVKQRLWGIKLNGTATVNSSITLEGQKIGILTSYITTEQGNFGLGYIRTKAGGVGLQVQIDTILAEVIAVPFLSHQYLE